MVRRFGDGIAFAVPQLHGELQDLFPRVEAGPQGRVSIRIGGPLADLELVKVNPGLAEYFGTSEGLLVVEAPSDSSLNLRAGDVILGIGGRHPTSPAQALRILGTYEPGENVSFEVMRQKRRATVNGKMPAAERGWRIQRNSFELPEGPETRMMRVPQGGVMRIMM
jgi:S1-C subfamily serine protease